MSQSQKIPTARDLLIFRALLVLFAGFAPWLLYRRGLPAAAAIALGAFFLLLAVGSQVVPAWRMPIYRGWMRVVSPIGATISFVLLAITFLLVVTPIAWLRRGAGSDPLQRQFSREATTYWRPRARSSPDSYFKEF